MSDILEAIMQRRAIKVFDPVEISPDTREQILNAARVAPSSFNIQPYRFYLGGDAGDEDARLHGYASVRAPPRAHRH